MKFVMVNGRTPRPQSLCAFCCRSIVNGYLRELATRRFYCDQGCHSGYKKVAIRVSQNRVKAS